MPAPLAPDLKIKAEKLFLAGFTSVEIGSQLGVPSRTVNTWSQRHEWAAKREQIKQKVVLTVLDESGANLQRRSAKARDMLAQAVESQLAVITGNPPQTPSDLANCPERQGQAAVLKTVADSAKIAFNWDGEKVAGLVIVDALRVFDEVKPVVEVEAEQVSHECGQ